MTDRLTQLRLDEAVTPVQDLLTPDPLIVRLNKVFSWQQSASRWPYYLSRADASRVYTKREIAAEIFGDDAIHHETPAGKGWLTSIFGVVVDWEQVEVRLEGVGLFESSDGDRARFRVSSDGLALAHAYTTDRASQNWQRVFAGILARNDVRVRAVLLHLSRWSAYLTFHTNSADGFFTVGSGGTLRMPDGEECPLFNYERGGKPAYSFTPILRRDTYATLGPVLRATIERAGVRVPEHIEFEGGRDTFKVHKEPSGNDLRLHMKQALALFKDIGALVYVPHRGGWTLDQARCALLFEPELVADLFAGAPTQRFLEALQSAYQKLSDNDGYVRVTDIRGYVCDELDIPSGEHIDYFNAQIAYNMRPDVGNLRIGRTFHAQATPDECLFGNLDMEYVEFEFTR